MITTQSAGGDQPTTYTQAAPATYIAAIAVEDMFVDPAYQRELDQKRAQAMSIGWDPRLAGVLDVSDRGLPPEGSMAARFAIINGQHRWAAAGLRNPDMHLVCNVHTGLSLDQEAQLFWDIDRQTKKLSTWDRWYARRAAGDRVVCDVERIANECQWTVTHHPGERNLQCAGALEYIYDRTCPETLADTLVLIQDVWPGAGEAKTATTLKGISLVLFEYSKTLDSGRLADAMSNITARQLVARAQDLKTRGTTGSLSRLIAIVLVQLYNRQPGTGRLDLAVIA